MQPFPPRSKSHLAWIKVKNPKAAERRLDDAALKHGAGSAF
jgi:hypothetical protein